MQRQEFQKTLNKVMECEAQLKTIEDQIQRLEQIYLHHTWEEGNIVIGWNTAMRAVGPKPTTKDKVFSLSSVKSNPTHYLEEGVSKQLTSEVEDCIVRDYLNRKTRKEIAIIRLGKGEKTDYLYVMLSIFSCYLKSADLHCHYIQIQTMSQAPSKKKKQVEEEYTMLKPIEHILKRSDTYVGSLQRQNEPQWVLNEDETQIVEKTISYIPALYKIYDEVLVNAADNYQRDKTMNYLNIQINQTQGFVKVHNNGRGIPVTKHKQHNIYVPEMIFGHLLTGSNYNDDEKRFGGGRNGYGAKLANIFSTRFTVECGDTEYQKIFFMEWNNNMQPKGVPTITQNKKNKSFVEITFYPDFKRFGMAKFEPDIVNLFKKRAYDMAGVLPKVKVILNGKQLKIKSFSDYVDLYLGLPSEDNQHVKITAGKDNDNKYWEVIISRSDGQFKQVSFVNAICTYKGGTHITNVIDQIVPRINEKLKNDAIKVHQVKSKLFVFINCLIVNPVFDSQLKDNLTSRPKNFGSTWEITQKMVKSIISTGIVEELAKEAQARQLNKMSKNTAGGKKARLVDVPKLEDANQAGTKHSQNCILILTEGDSAKALAVAGLSVVGRDKFGVFPLRGKLLNVRQKDKKSVMENAQLNNITKIIGLQYGKQYVDLKSLRYGSIMIMTDQDADGSHIKGLIINFINYYWPSLFKTNGFLRQFITPLLKSTKGNQVKSFFTIQDFKSWSSTIPNMKAWKIKYYKGLGTSTNKEGQEYFKNINAHEKIFRYEGDEDITKIDMAFSKKRADDRKQWLSHYDPEDIIELSPATKNISYKDFIDKQLIHFSNSSNRRAIPSLMDGLKPGQRKVLFACFKRNLKQEIKVAQLAGYVAEHSAYHHGEMSLTQTIILLAQNFVGSNNINLLLPNGQFGSRSEGGNDHASARYVFTALSRITRVIFPEADDHSLKYLEDDGQMVEPQFYVPIFPMILVNGSQGMGTGWSTYIPNHDPREIAEQIKKRINGQPFVKIIPWYKGFQGEILEVEGGVTTRGLLFKEENSNTLHVKELPIGKWTIKFKEMLNQYITKQQHVVGLRQYHTQDRVHFQIDFQDGYFNSNDDGDIFNFLKLSTKKHLSNMVAFNPQNQLIRYNTAMAIMEQYYHIRLHFYTKRKEYLVSKLRRDAQILEAKTKFVLDVVENRLEVRNIKKKILCQKLLKEGYKKYSEFTKVQTTKKIPLEKKVKDNGDDASEEEAQQNLGTGEVSAADYNYLLTMPIWSLTFEKVQAMKRDLEIKMTELNILLNTKQTQMWLKDLDVFLKVLEEITQEQRIQREKADQEAKGVKGKKNKKQLKKVQKNKNSQSDDGSPVKAKKGKKKSNDGDDSSRQSSPGTQKRQVKKQEGKGSRRRKDSVSTSKSEAQSQAKLIKESLVSDTPFKQQVSGIKEQKVRQKLNNQKKQKPSKQGKDSQPTLDELYLKYMSQSDKPVDNSQMQKLKDNQLFEKKVKSNQQRESKEFIAKKPQPQSSSDEGDNSLGVRPQFNNRFKKKNFEDDQENDG